MLSFIDRFVIGLTLFIRPTRLFSPNRSDKSHLTKSGRKIKIYRFTIYFWAKMSDTEREGGLFVSLSNLVLKAKNLLFVQYNDIISTQHNLWISLFQAKLLRPRANSYQPPDAVVAQGPWVRITNETVEKGSLHRFISP
jgi:hypothetical protein